MYRRQENIESYTTYFNMICTERWNSVRWLYDRYIVIRTHRGKHLKYGIGRRCVDRVRKPTIQSLESAE